LLDLLDLSKQKEVLEKMDLLGEKERNDILKQSVSVDLSSAGIS